jgi:hypothetical protein
MTNIQPPVELANALLLDAFGRVAEDLPHLLDGLTPEEIRWQPDPAANSIGWLVWHLSRVQDDHLAGVDHCEQVWTAAGFAERFGLAYGVREIGYGHSAAQVRAFSVTDAALLAAYHEAVHAQTVRIVTALDTAGFARIVDERWDPPVTAAVRLVSVVNDITSHLGQAQYLLGLRRRAAAAS